MVTAAWLGAAVLTAGVVAPAGFAVLPSRALAGALVGRVLPVLSLSGALVATLALVVMRGRRALMVRLAPVMWLAAMVVAQFGVSPRLRVLRERIGPSLEALPASDRRRIDFGRLHAVSVGLLGVGIVGAGILLAANRRSARPTEG